MANEVYNRPGRVVYVKNTEQSAAINHGKPAIEGNFVGIAIKQKGPTWDEGTANLKKIADDEDYILLVKGVVECTLGSVAQGDAIFITSANAITKTEGSNTPFGTVVEDENIRGVRPGMCRIDLDLKPLITV